VAVLVCNAKATARVVSVQLASSWCLWCRFAAEVVVGGRNGFVVEVAEVDGVGFGYVGVKVVVVDGFGLAGFMPLLLLTENIEGVL
jgi:hypothetical protein